MRKRKPRAPKTYPIEQLVEDLRWLIVEGGCEGTVIFGTATLNGLADLVQERRMAVAQRKLLASLEAQVALTPPSRRS